MLWRFFFFFFRFCHVKKPFSHPSSAPQHTQSQVFGKGKGDGGGSAVAPALAARRWVGIDYRNHDYSPLSFGGVQLSARCLGEDIIQRAGGAPLNVT